MMFIMHTSICTYMYMSHVLHIYLSMESSASMYTQIAGDGRVLHWTTDVVSWPGKVVHRHEDSIAQSTETELDLPEYL